jgi:hypothetical protein
MKKILLILLPIIVVYIFINYNKDIVRPSEPLVKKIEQENSFYVNEEYNFNIHFPINWSLSPGDEQPTVQQARSGSSFIFVDAYKMHPMFSDGIVTVKDVGNLSDYKDNSIDGLQKEYPGAKLIDYGESNINNEPAYWIKYTFDRNIEMTIIQYQIFKNNNIYTIALNSPSDQVSTVETDFIKSVETLTISNDF